MKPKHKRLAWVLGLTVCAGAGAAIVLTTFQRNLVFFHSPSELAALSPAERGKSMRLGGMVERGSLTHDASGLLHFRVTDFKRTLNVAYRGEVPALFREGQGVVAEGILAPDQTFRAKRLLAKHDEKYMPPEIARTMKRADTAP